MKATQAADRLLQALDLELHRHRGRIQDIEKSLDLSRGYLRKQIAGKRSISLLQWCEAIEATGADTMQVLADALDVPPGAESMLQRVEQDAETPRDLLEMERLVITLAVEVRRLPAASEDMPEEAEASATARRMARRTVTQQKRSLRHNKLCRHPAFVNAYLGELDKLRLDDPPGAAKLVHTLAVDLLPLVAASPRVRAALTCRAFGVLGAAYRLVADLPSAAHAERLGLELARELGGTVLADLLQRASYVLRDTGRYRQALFVLREAFEIYFDRDDRASMGKVLVDRGLTLHAAGDLQKALKTLERSLECLPQNLVRNRLAAVHTLSIVCSDLGDIDAADHWLDECAKVARHVSKTAWAKVMWRRGVNALARRSYPAAEEHLRAAMTALSESDPFSVSVSVDLVEAYLMQGRLSEACDLASRMARFCGKIEAENRFLQRSVLELAQAGMKGEISRELIRKARKALRDKEALPEKRRA